MRAVTLLALWFTVYGNINKTWKKCHDMQLSCIDRLNNLSPILIGVSNRCEFHSQLSHVRTNNWPISHLAASNSPYLTLSIIVPCLVITSQTLNPFE